MPGLLLFGLGWAGCREELRASADAGSASDTGNNNSTHIVETSDAAQADGPPPTGARICDGDVAIRLAVRWGGSGQVSPGEAMLSEHGSRFLLVDSRCTAWVLEWAGDPLRTTVLSPSQEQRLIVDLRLGDWSDIPPQTHGGCFDGPAVTFRFGGQRVSGPTCGPPSSHPLISLYAAYSSIASEIYAEATAVTGSVRYLVVEDDLGTIDPRAAVAWPLESSLAELAAPRVAAYRPADSLVASGIDADRLRAIRTTSKTGQLPNGAILNSTRVAGADGTTYRLFVRDSLPFEDAEGQLPDGTF